MMIGFLAGIRGEIGRWWRFTFQEVTLWDQGTSHPHWKCRPVKAPALSVILACSDDFSTVARTLRALREQEICSEMELVLVAPLQSSLQIDERQLRGFWSYQVVYTEATSFDSIAQANAAGIRQAQADIVVLAEDHSFPEKGWAEALLDAHRGPWAAVGPAVTNANPETALSWADFWIGYGPWAAPCRSQERDFLPGHNSSYKRSELAYYEARLEEVLQSETVLHFDLRARGRRLYLCGDARTAHVNFSRPGSWIRVQVDNGRVFAGQRCSSWPPWRRWLYALASPLIPWVRGFRILRNSFPKPGLIRALPWLSLGLALDGLGQMLGYAWGPGNSAQNLVNYEFRRMDHISAADRESIFGDSR